MEEEESPINTGDVIRQRFEVRDSLGAGGYGVVFEVWDRTAKEQCAIKVETSRPSDNEPGLEVEIAVIKKLQGSTHVTSFKDEGSVGPLRYVIMQLVGRNLTDLRVHSPNSKFTPYATRWLAVQCLNAIQDVHKVGFVHRDIKPGTVRYASVNAHKNKDLGRVDDLMSWFYGVVEMYRGDLPWRKEPNKERVGRMKEACTRSQLMGSMEEQEPEYKAIYTHLTNLNFSSDPDYSWMKKSLERLGERHGYSASAPLDWEQGGAAFIESQRAAVQPYAVQMQARNDIVRARLPGEPSDEAANDAALAPPQN